MAGKRGLGGSEDGPRFAPVWKAEGVMTDGVGFARHCERSEAIQYVLVRLWSASLRSQ